MLAKYLKDLRKAQVVQSAMAQSQLGAGWEVAEDGALTKEFVFEDHNIAAFFMARYADYCQKVNLAPQWSNVYNRVNVRLANAEFGGVTTKELNAGMYLEAVATVRLSEDIDDDLPFERILERSEVLAIESTTNDQQSPTSLLLQEAEKQSNSQLRLEQ